MLNNRVQIDKEYVRIIVEKNYDKKSNYKRTKKLSTFIVTFSALGLLIFLLTLFIMYLYPESRDVYLKKYIMFFIILSSILLIYFSINLIKKKDITEGLQKKIAIAIVFKVIKRKMNNTFITIEITEDKIITKTNRDPIDGSGEWSSFSSYTLRDHFYVLEDSGKTYYLILDQNGFESEGDKEKFEKMLNDKLEYME